MFIFFLSIVSRNISTFSLLIKATSLILVLAILTVLKYGSVVIEQREAPVLDKTSKVWSG